MRNIPAHYIVCVDESGVDRRTGTQRHGWTPADQNPVACSRLERGKRFQLLPALTIDGILDAFVFKGHADKDGFLLWIRDHVLPKMNPFPGPNSVLVMDNVSWHHDKDMKELVK